MKRSEKPAVHTWTRANIDFAIKKHGYQGIRDQDGFEVLIMTVEHNHPPDLAALIIDVLSNPEPEDAICLDLSKSTPAKNEIELSKHMALYSANSANQIVFQAAFFVAFPTYPDRAAEIGAALVFAKNDVFVSSGRHCVSATTEMAYYSAKPNSRSFHLSADSLVEMFLEYASERGKIRDNQDMQASEFLIDCYRALYGAVIDAGVYWPQMRVLLSSLESNALRVKAADVGNLIFRSLECMARAVCADAVINMTIEPDLINANDVDFLTSGW